MKYLIYLLYDYLKFIFIKTFFSLRSPKNSLFFRKPLVFYRTKTGNYYLPANAVRDCIAGAIRTNRVYEPEIVEVARRYIQTNSIVLDIGSNFGQMAVMFSSMVGKEGLVFSFDADDYVFSILQKNINANNCQNIRAFFGAVYNERNKFMFFPEQDFKKFSAYGSYGLDPKARSGRKVETIMIDDLNIRRKISFMKVDVQGSDLFAMQGAVNTIRQHRMPIIFEFEEQSQNEFGTSFQDYLNFIDSIGYKIIETVYKINYLIVPDNTKKFCLSDSNTSNDKLIDEDPKEVASFNPRLVSPRTHLCKFLKTRFEVETCTQFLNKNGFVSHNLRCKDWDLAHIVPEIDEGNFLDMGSSDSYILKNVALRRIPGKLYGIDLQKPDVSVEGVNYVVGDLMQTCFPDQFFKNISCLSVIEHQVDFTKFAAETSRLLQSGGKLFVTFDYWDPKIKTPIKIFKLDWQPLDRFLLTKFIEECAKKKLFLIENVDWSIKDPVINSNYYSPHSNVSYTFGILVFEKR